MKNSQKILTKNNIMPQEETKKGYQTPTELINLPSKGEFYPKDHPWKDVESVEIRYMTTLHEDIIVSPSLRSKGETMNKLFDALLVSPKCSWNSVLEGDRNAVLLSARKTAYGNEATLKSSCSSCGILNHVFVDLDSLAEKPWEIILEKEYAKYDEENNLFSCVLPRSKLSIEFKLQDSESSKKIVDAVRKRAEHGLQEKILSETLRSSIISINGNKDPLILVGQIDEFPAYDMSWFFHLLQNVSPGYETNIDFACSSCGSQEKKMLEVQSSSFLIPEINFFR